METRWFAKTEHGALWYPITWQGWAASTLWLISNIWFLLSYDMTSYSVSDTFVAVGFFFIGSTVVLLTVIHYTSGRNWI